MILTICPNPSIDCTIELDALNVGKLNRIANKVETYSGKALNVAIGVSRLNGKSIASGFMFDESSAMFERTLLKEGVTYKFVYNKGSARVNYKIIDNKSMLTEINDKGENVSRDKQKELIQLVKTLSSSVDIVVMSGSLPAGVESSYYDEVLSILPSGVKIIVDTEKVNMDQALKNHIFMVKPNLYELESFAETTVKTKADMVKCATKYLNRGVQNVLISLGAEGAVLTDGIKNYYCKSANVAINSTVGAGDSMVAAACVNLERGESMKELLKQSVAAGTASITTPGTNLFYKDKFDEIYTKLQVEEFFV